MIKKSAQNQGAAIGNRPLIVSYSYSGNTHRIAQAIQNLTNGDWSEIYPWQPYPMAFPELLEQVKQEIQSGYKPRLLPGFNLPKHYQVIFVGSPNWCGTISRPHREAAGAYTPTDSPVLPVPAILETPSGKLILPFYSHCGGVPCDFKRDISLLCPRAEVREALRVIDDGGDNLIKILQEWLDKMDVDHMGVVKGEE